MTMWLAALLTLCVASIALAEDWTNDAAYYTQYQTRTNLNEALTERCLYAGVSTNGLLEAPYWREDIPAWVSSWDRIASNVVTLPTRPWIRINATNSSGTLDTWFSTNQTETLPPTWTWDTTARDITGSAGFSTSSSVWINVADLQERKDFIDRLIWNYIPDSEIDRDSGSSPERKGRTHYRSGSAINPTNLAQAVYDAQLIARTNFYESFGQRDVNLYSEDREF